tara:strand:- start:513 stop:764 length:252 start_codon:yes stop_codon:yes gene_type:complete
MDIKIYTSPGCFYCDKAKELCKRAKLEYKSIEIGSDITREEFYQIYPDVISSPHIIIDGEVIGGLVETARFFLKEGLVSANKG